MVRSFLRTSSEKELTMAKGQNTADPRRVADIAEKLRQACGAIGSDHSDILDAQALINDRSGKLANTRVAVAAQVAALSFAEGWTNAEIAEGCDAAAKGINAPEGTAKTIGVFISEMRTFASPKVRDTFPTTLAACQEAWTAEAEEIASMGPGEKADTPCRKFKQRLYHLVMDVARQIKKGELSVDDADDIVRYCRANDPDFDAKKVSARLAGIVEKLDGMFDDFGMGSIRTAADFLRTIKAEELLASRKLLLAGQPPAFTQPPAPTPEPESTPHDDILDETPAYDPEPEPVVEAAPEPTPEPEPEPTPEPVVEAAPAPVPTEAVTIMEGAVDIGLGDDLFDTEATPTLALAAHASAASANAAAASVMAEAA
jgi:hypothetical protein